MEVAEAQGPTERSAFAESAQYPIVSRADEYVTL